MDQSADSVVRREVDLDLVSTSWRSLTEESAFEPMMEAWERKLRLARRQPHIPLLDGALRKHLNAIDQLLSDGREIQIEDPLEAVLAETPAPAMVVSPNGLVATLNYGAATYFGVEQGAMAGTDWLREDSLGDYRAVHVAALRGDNVDYAIVRTETSSDQAAFAEVFKLNGPEEVTGFTVVRSLELDWDASISLALSKAFGLTQAECEVCELLFALRDLSLIAEKRSVALGTVRMQVKSILSKSEIHSKTELVRLLAQLCARAASRRAQMDLSWNDPLGKERIFHRSDGRKLAYTWCGAEDGQPVLYLPDHTSCNVFPERIRSILKDKGVKLLIVSLPGFGNSDPATKQEHFVDCCAALEEWAEAQPTPLVGAMGGRGAQFYLMRVAQLRPDLFPQLLGLGLPWNITPKRASEMGMIDKTLLKLCLDAPFAYDIAIRTGYNMLRKHGPDGYWRMIFSSNEADLQTTKGFEALPLLRATVRHLYAQGHQVLMRSQEVCASYSISEWVKELRTPLHWLVPEFSTTLSSDDLEEIRCLNPLATLESLEGAGNLVMFQKPEALADRIVRFARR